MKREGDKGKERQGILLGLWQPSCLIWKHLTFHGWGVVSSATGSGPQMDYSKSNRNTWIWDAFRARECALLFFATFYVCPSSSVHHPSSCARHQSLPISVSIAYSRLAPLPRADILVWVKKKRFTFAKICQCVVLAVAYINNVRKKKKKHWWLCACTWNVIT